MSNAKALHQLIGGLVEDHPDLVLLLAEIAERLYLSPATAKTHVGRLLMKLQARDRTQLVVIAYETGLVTPNSQ